MRELRHDPIQKRWVIIASERSSRPADLQARDEVSDSTHCPFCAGHEGETPPEIFAFRPLHSAPNTPGWEVRVTSNKYPALRIEGDITRRGVGMYDVISGVGAHEVIIESPEHDKKFPDYSDDHLAKVIIAYRERVRDLMKDGRLRYILLFKNEGELAGASFYHSHTQLIATPVTPRTVALELETSRAYFNAKERCLICDLLAQEQDTEARVICENSRFIAVCPFASRFPYEVFIAPKQHAHDFTMLDDMGARSLGIMLRDVVYRLCKALNNPAYNFVIHTAPNTVTTPRRSGYWSTLPYDFHWHVEIIPRLTRVAGFEWGTGFYINSTPPEKAASALRAAGEFGTTGVHFIGT